MRIQQDKLFHAPYKNVCLTYFVCVCVLFFFGFEINLCQFCSQLLETGQEQLDINTTLTPKNINFKYLDGVAEIRLLKTLRVSYLAPRVHFKAKNFITVGFILCIIGIVPLPQPFQFALFMSIKGEKIHFMVCLRINFGISI